MDAFYIDGGNISDYQNDWKNDYVNEEDDGKIKCFSCGGSIDGQYFAKVSADEIRYQVSKELSIPLDIKEFYVCEDCFKNMEVDGQLLSEKANDIIK